MALLSRGRYSFGNLARHVLILVGCYFLGLLFCMPSPPEAERLLCVPCFLRSLSAGLAGGRYEAPMLYHGKAHGRTQTSAFTIGKKEQNLWPCPGSWSTGGVRTHLALGLCARRQIFPYKLAVLRNISEEGSLQGHFSPPSAVL